MSKQKWLDDNGNEITEEYIIINKTAVQKRIEDLGKEYILLSNKSDRSLSDIEEEREIVGEQKALARVLSQSTSLIPEIKDIQIWLSKQSYQKEYGEQEYMMYYDVDIPKIIQDYIANLKLDI